MSSLPVGPQVGSKDSEAQALQQQRDQYLGHLQQYAAACQQLGAEKEQLQQQVLLQNQHLDRLQHEQARAQDELDEAQRALREAQVRARPAAGRAGPELPPHGPSLPQGLLRASEEQKQQLQAQLGAALMPGKGEWPGCGGCPGLLSPGRLCPWQPRPRWLLLRPSCPHSE